MYTESLGATPTATTYLATPDPFNIAVNQGLEPNTTAGLADYQNAHAAVTTGGRKQLLESRPELAALIACSMVNAIAAGRSINDIMADLLLVNDNVANSNEVVGIWTDIWGKDSPGSYGADPTSPGARYVAAVNKYIGFFVAGPGTSFGRSPAQNAAVVGQQAWNAALKGPVWTAPPEWWAFEFGGQGSRPDNQIPLSDVFYGPTTQSDGMVVIAWNDPRDGKDYVYRWPGPTFRPAHISFPSANPAAVNRFNVGQQPQNIQNKNPWVLDSNNDLVQLPDPGTGDWSGITSLPARVQALFLSQGTPTLVDPLTLTPIAPPPMSTYAAPAPPPLVQVTQAAVTPVLLAPAASSGGDLLTQPVGEPVAAMVHPVDVVAAASVAPASNTMPLILLAVLGVVAFASRSRK
jgi:hypothetical protein